MTTPQAYPSELEFSSDCEGDDRTAVLAAAAELGLTVTRRDQGAFTVTVTSPKEAYEFGAYTQAHFVKTLARRR